MRKVDYYLCINLEMMYRNLLSRLREFGWWALGKSVEKVVSFLSFLTPDKFLALIFFSFYSFPFGRVCTLFPPNPSIFFVDHAFDVMESSFLSWVIFFLFALLNSILYKLIGETAGSKLMDLFVSLLFVVSFLLLDIDGDGLLSADEIARIFLVQYTLFSSSFAQLLPESHNELGKLHDLLLGGGDTSESMKKEIFDLAQTVVETVLSLFSFQLVPLFLLSREFQDIFISIISAFTIFSSWSHHFYSMHLASQEYHVTK